LDGRKLHRKVKSPNSEAKIVRVGTKLKDFSKPTGKGEQWIMHLSLRWREKSSSGFEFWRENGLAVQSFETAVQKAATNT